MTWSMYEGKISRGPYSIIRDTRGEFSIWFKADQHYGILKRGFTALDSAKEYATAHAKKEVFQAKDLDAVFVK
jgi:hypothetical protein